MRGKRYNLYQISRECQVDTFEKFDKEALRRFIDYERQVLKVSAATVNRRIKEVKCIIGWLRDEFELEIPLKLNRVRMLKEGPPRRKFYSREDIYKVIAMADHEDRLLIRMMFEMALRITEAINIKIDDIDGRRVFIIGKGRKAANVYMSEELSEYVNLYIEARGLDGYLFPAKHAACEGKPISKGAASVRIKKAFLRAGISGAYPHAIRHSRATDLQRNGAPNDVIKEFLRHSSVSTTEVYMHYFSDNLERQFDKFTVVPGAGK